MAGKLSASFASAQLDELPSLGLKKASELGTATFPPLRRSQSRTEAAGGRGRWPGMLSGFISGAQQGPASVLGREELTDAPQKERSLLPSPHPPRAAVVGEVAAACDSLCCSLFADASPLRLAKSRAGAGEAAAPCQPQHPESHSTPRDTAPRETQHPASHSTL